MEKELDHIENKRRKLMLRIWGGVEPVHAITMPLYYLDLHFPQDRLDDALHWLIKNKYTGQNFVTFWRDRCAKSNLEMHRHIVQGLKKDDALKPIFAGKEFRT